VGAERVESESEAPFLCIISVDQAQGWLWSRVIPAEQFKTLSVPMKSDTQSLWRIRKAS
jgi:EAL domain-containing protein (putative c-di-GMP-specific phosphodiesterase class I)